MMGVPWDDCEKVGDLIGTKTIINEFVAYMKLVEIKDTFTSVRSQLVHSFSFR